MAKYNRASRLVSALLQVWRQATGQTQQHLARALASAPDAAEQLQRLVRQSPGNEFPADDLLVRLEHFRVENEQVVPQAGDALAAGDLTGFARAVDRSQAAAERLLGNQVPETIALAAQARQAGALTASAFGAAFPALAPRAKFFLTGAGPAACRIR
jgi:galactokinase